MYRSKKLQKKKAETKKIEDPEKIAFRKYLGELGDEEETKQSKWLASDRAFKVKE